MFTSSKGMFFNNSPFVFFRHWLAYLIWIFGQARSWEYFDASHIDQHNFHARVLVRPDIVWHKYARQNFSLLVTTRVNGLHARRD